MLPAELNSGVKNNAIAIESTEWSGDDMYGNVPQYRFPSEE